MSCNKRWNVVISQCVQRLLENALEQVMHCAIAHLPDHVHLQLKAWAAMMDQQNSVPKEKISYTTHSFGGFENPKPYQHMFPKH